MSIRVAINGFGRIGRASLKVALKNKSLQVVAINDLMDNKTLAYLLKNDTVYGQYEKKVKPVKEGIEIDGVVVPVYAIKEPDKLPWKKLNVDIVLECTGRFTKSDMARQHLKAGAKRVLLSAPGSDSNFQTLVLGTKYTEKNLGKSLLVSNASCTTNSTSPVIQVLQNAFGIEKALMTTIHAYTADQCLVDGPHRDLRRARAAAQNIIPTTTGAAISTTEVVPELKKLFDGVAIRVPVICGSISDITALLKRKKLTVDQVNEAFKKAAKEPMFKNILTVSNKPIVSSDIIGSSYSAIVDLELTKVIGGNLVKVFAWYDNEYGYSVRLVEMAEKLGKSIK